jgi:hypothetical protein
LVWLTRIICLVILSCGFRGGGTYLNGPAINPKVEVSNISGLYWTGSNRLVMFRAKTYLEVRMSFESALEKTLHIEGGLSLDPADNGNWTGGARGKGELKGTKYGISAAQYPSEDIPNLTLSQAKAIYKRDYWDTLKLDEVHHEALQEKIFDTCVNMGTETAAILLQNAINFLQPEDQPVDVDGSVGPQTIQAVNALCQTHDLALLLTFRCMRFTKYFEIIRKNPVLRKYRFSWLSRI